MGVLMVVVAGYCEGIATAAIPLGAAAVKDSDRGGTGGANLLGLVCWFIAGELSDVEGEVAMSHDPQDPHVLWVRSMILTASAGSSTCHLLADMSKMRIVRRAQSHPSAISSRLLKPWMISLWAFLSGRLRMWMVQAVWAM